MLSNAYKTNKLTLRLLELCRSSVRKLPKDITKITKINMAKVSIYNNRLYIGERLFIPLEDNLTLTLMRLAYNSLGAGYTRRASTYSYLYPFYY